MLTLGATASAERELIFLGPPVPAPAPINDESANIMGSISADGRELYFWSNRNLTDITTDIWVTKRATTDDAWGEPENLGLPVNTDLSERHGAITGDGLELFFRRGESPFSDDPGDLWVATRPTTDHPWTDVMDLGPTVNSLFGDNYPSVTADGLELYFDSHRPGYPDAVNVFVSLRASRSESFGVPQLVEPRAGGPGISPDGLILFFASKRAGGVGNDDLWMRTRATRNGEFGPPVNLWAINSLQREWGAELSDDGSTLYFSSTRFGVPDDGEFGKFGVWQVELDTDLLRISSPPDAIYTVIDNDSDANFDGLGDATSDITSKTRATVGEIDLADANRVNRLVAKFTLPDAPDSMPILESASLRIFLEHIKGTPAGPASLFHSTSDNDLEQLPSDFENATYTDTALDLVGPADEADRYYELDVTDLVRADYAADGDNPMSAFRLQVTEVLFLEDDQTNRYRFTMPAAGNNPPELVLTFVPEPTTWFMAAIASLWFVGRVPPRACKRHMGGSRG